MKKSYTLLMTVLVTACVFAQSPNKMSYQAVIRDASNVLVTYSSVGMQISILQGSPTGTAVYVETQTPTSNANGLVSIEIGAGTVVSGTFSAIDWANGSYYVKTETDPTGGTTYTIIGTSQLLSVPYALYAKSVEIDNVDDADADSTNELQSLSFTNDTLSLSGGGMVVLPYDSAVWTKVNDTTITYNDVTINTAIAAATDYNMTLKKYISPYNVLDLSRGSGINGIRFQLSSVNESMIAYSPNTSKEFNIGTADSNRVSLITDNTKRLTITAEGDVGIGTTAPGGIFEIAANTTTPRIRFDNISSNSVSNSIRHIYNLNTDAMIRTAFEIKPSFNDVADGTRNSFVELKTVASGSFGTRMTFNGAIVGIGTTSPARQLHVNDVMRLEPRSSAPSSPSAGDIYYDSTLNNLRFYDGTAWRNCF